MANLIQHLAAVSTGYKVFEDNQVLTKEPLNALVDYLDDQERLTRVALLGVGIIDGLRVSVSNDVVVLTTGVGVTTDGDLVRVPADLEYTRFRAYDESAPKYDRLYKGQNMLKVFELVGEDVDTAATLGTFSTETGKKLEEMVAVLLMESFLKDQDLCTGGDCDNKGKDALSNVKLLLLDQNDIGLLIAKMGTFDDVSASLTPAFADRVVLNPQINSAAALNNAYRAAANQTRDRLKKVLQAPVFSNTNTFGGEVFTSNPVPGWIVKLDTAVPDTGIQAFYDFLSDVADAYNAVGEALAGEISVLCPALNLFPKHLLLGVVGGFSSPPVRTGFYPSPLVRAAAEAMARARFFVKRVDALITSFTPVLDAAAPISVTPSQTADRPLDDRAIPAYYTVNMNAPRPIHNAWSYGRARRKLARHNYSANGQKYQAQGAAAAPLTARLDAFSFFRIEGHLGKPVTTAVSQIEAKITQSNLPFTVRAVLLGGTRPQIRVKPPIRYTDLHRLHHLIRHDVTLHLDDVIAQSDRFKADVDLAVLDKVIDDRALGEELSIKGFAEETRQKVQASGTSAKTKLARRYSQYKTEPWQDEVKETMNQSAGMRLRLGEVSRTELVSPVDSLVANKHALWAEWLDQIIGTRDEAEDEKLLFANFIAQHPGADHAGGVARGGTFVLVYDSGGTVVADLALPYYWPESAEPEPDQPPLAPPKSRPPIVIDKGWRVRKPTPKLVLDNINVRFDDFQRNYLQAVRDSVQIFTPIKDLTGGLVPVPPGFDDRVIKDPTLRVQLHDTMAKAERLQQIRRLLVTPSLDAVRRTQLEQLLKVADRDLGDSIKETTRVVTGAGIEVETEGAAAAAVVANAFAHLTGTTASGVAKTIRTQASAAGVPTGAKTLVSAVLKGSGLKL